MKKIAIIGVGLIGGSLGMALRAKSAGAYRVIGLGRNEKKLKLAKRLGAVDDFTTDWAKGVKDADIVVVCTPVDLIAESVRRILPFIKQGAIITDVGSVKASVAKEVQKVLSRLPSPVSRLPVFIGGHPLAGAERSGVESASASLFNKASVVLVGARGSSALGAIIKMWKKTGADVIVMEPERHDRIVSTTSHLPHVLAFNLCLAVKSLQGKDPQASRLLAGSFKDMTRVADSNPRDWAAICHNNRQEIARAIDSYTKELAKIKNSLSDTGKLEVIFTSAKAARKNILEDRETVDGKR